MFDALGMVDVAARLALASELASELGSGLVSGLGTALVTRPTVPALSVAPALSPVLPDGLRRGSTIAVSGSVTLLLAVLSAASAQGAWCALVGMPTISAEAARDVGVELSRLPLVPAPGPRWVEVVGALLDAMDIVVARAPAQVGDADIRRLVARARSRGTILVPFVTAGSRWPHADVRLRVAGGEWSGIGDGYGRLRQRQITVTAEGRGQAARPRSTTVWLPAAAGGVEPCAPTTPLAVVV